MSRITKINGFIAKTAEYGRARNIRERNISGKTACFMKDSVPSLFGSNPKDDIYNVLNFLTKANKSEGLKIFSLDNLYEHYTRSHPNPVDKETIEKVLKNLVEELKVEKTDNGYKVYHQGQKINDITAELIRDLERIDNLHGLISLLNHSLRQLFQHVDLYLFNNKTEKEFRIVSRTTGETASSHYNEWNEAQTTLAELVRRFKSTKSPIFVVDPTEDNPYIDKESRENDFRIFSTSDEKFITGLLKTDGDVYGAFVVRNWRLKGDSAPSIPLYSPNDNMRAVNAALASFTTQVANEISRIVQGKRKTVKEIWEEEEEGLAVGEFQSPSIIYPLLTGDNLFNPLNHFPTTPSEYKNLLRRITDSNGVFPGDSRAPVPSDRYLDGSTCVRIKRKVVTYLAEFINPEYDLVGMENRFAFDTTLLFLQALHETYGKGGLYDKNDYVLNRWWKCQVSMLWHDGMPIGFHAVKRHETEIDGEKVEYHFVHGMAVAGSTQRKGMSTYILSEVFSRILYWNIVLNLFKRGKNIIVDPQTGNLVNDRWRIWVVGHSGKASIFHFSHRNLDSGEYLSGRPDRVQQGIILDAHRYIHPEDQTASRLDLTTFRDEEAYINPDTRYPLDENDNVIISQGERNLSDFPKFLELIGGEEGLKKGNSLYSIGLLRNRRLKEIKKEGLKRQPRKTEKHSFLEFLDAIRRRIIAWKYNRKP